MLRDRDALTGMLRSGLLHLTLEQRRAESSIAATHFQSAMREAERLGDEVLEVVRSWCVLNLSGGCRSCPNAINGLGGQKRPTCPKIHTL